MSVLAARREIIIEDDVFIGAGCMIYDNNFHSIDFEKRVLHGGGEDKDIKCERVIIRKGAFIGAQCIILKGVEIGEYSVVGAGSVVVKSIPPGEIWAGNPAKLCKKI